MSATILMDGATALFSSAITVQRLHADIINPADLRDRVVATVEFTPSVPTMNYPAAEQRDIYKGNETPQAAGN